MIIESVENRKKYLTDFCYILERIEHIGSVSNIPIGISPSIKKNFFPDNFIPSNNSIISLLTYILEPFFNKMEKLNKRIFSCEKERFLKKLKIYDISILDFFDQKIGSVSDGSTIILAGGKLIDFVSGKKFEFSSGDYDCWTFSREDHMNMVYLFSSLAAKPLVPDDSELNVGSKISLYSSKKRVTTFHYHDENHDKVAIQFINGNVECIEELLGAFDFRCCCIAYDGINFYWQSGALKDIKQSRIKVNSIKPSVVHSGRLSKYIRKGFDISQADFVLLSLANLFGLDYLQLDEDFNLKFLDSLLTGRDYSLDLKDEDLAQQTYNYNI